ncbi:hypothetical protein PTKIN_Ptkin09bG0240600 [Pterospermum kingtungense]
MANATGEAMSTQNYAKPENEGLQPGGGTTKRNRVHDLIFVKLQENPDPEAGIQKAMKLLANMNEDLFQITKKIEERVSDVCGTRNELCRLEYEEKRLRRSWTNDGKRLASLKRNLDKLTFANNAYKEKAIKTEDNINIHNLYFLMHHGTKSMAVEKKLFREVNASQKKVGDHADSGLPVVEEINDRIRKLRWNIRRNYFIPKPATMVDEKQLLKEIKELKWERDKAFANAPVKGKTWNSLPSKNEIKQQIKFMENASSDEARKEHLQLRGRIEVVKQEINVATKEINTLKRQLLDVQRKKGEVYKVILKLIKIQDQPI